MNYFFLGRSHNLRSLATCNMTIARTPISIGANTACQIAVGIIVVVVVDDDEVI